MELLERYNQMEDLNDHAGCTYLLACLYGNEGAIRAARSNLEFREMAGCASVELTQKALEATRGFYNKLKSGMPPNEGWEVEFSKVKYD